MNQNWKGQKFTTGLSITRYPGPEELWAIHDDSSIYPGFGDRDALVKLAQAILENLEENPEPPAAPSTRQLNWIKEYRRENPYAYLGQAQKAWLKHLEEEGQEEKQEERATA